MTHQQEPVTLNYLSLIVVCLILLQSIYKKAIDSATIEEGDNVLRYNVLLGKKDAEIATLQTEVQQLRKGMRHVLDVLPYHFVCCWMCLDGLLVD